MPKSFFFYDLETSGLSPSDDRVMQFAGQRTDENLQPIGEPYNILVSVNEDTLPSPDALLVTGITPQKTRDEGYTEAEFCKLLSEEIFTPDTIAVGFNNIRFDDEFIRHLFWRNFYDAYEWSWRDGRSRWDILDVVRMTRALRPDGINWPVVDGKPTNRLELLSSMNGLEHENAHDALSDVVALIGVAQLLRQKQRRLFDYLLDMRDKNKVKELVNLDRKQPFVYTSGRYGTSHNSTTVAFPLTAGRNGNVLVYDLRHDPTDFLNLSVAELREILYAPPAVRKTPGYKSLPVKELQYNRAPAVAPLSVLQGGGWQALELDPQTVEAHQKLLLSAPGFAENIRTLVEERPAYPKRADAEGQLYDAFVPDQDKIRIEAVRNADKDALADFNPDFTDERLPPLLLRYKARNYPTSLSESEQIQWEQWRATRIASKMPAFYARLGELATARTSPRDQYILQELQLWAESIMPADIETADEGQ